MLRNSVTDSPHEPRRFTVDHARLREQCFHSLQQKHLPALWRGPIPQGDHVRTSEDVKSSQSSADKKRKLELESGDHSESEIEPKRQRLIRSFGRDHVHSSTDCKALKSG